MLCPFKRLSSHRRRVGLWLTFVMMFVYFGFLFLVGFKSTILAQNLTSGLTLGILLSVFIIISALGLTILYVLWANFIYDPKINTLKETFFSESNN